MMGLFSRAQRINKRKVPLSLDIGLARTIEKYAQRAHITPEELLHRWLYLHEKRLYSQSAKAERLASVDDNPNAESRK